MREHTVTQRANRVLHAAIAGNATSTHRRMHSPRFDHRIIRGRMWPYHTARLSFQWEEVKMEDVQVAAAAYYLQVQVLVCLATGP
jgi:hypothetical protein